VAVHCHRWRAGGGGSMMPDTRAYGNQAETEGEGGLHFEELGDSGAQDVSEMAAFVMRRCSRIEQ
jgi:hypothetical protein